MTIDTYRQELKQLVRNNGSQGALAKSIGVDKSSMTNVLNGRRHFSVQLLFKVVDALGYRIEFVKKERAT